jgi:hypothetical protein
MGAMCPSASFHGDLASISMDASIICSGSSSQRALFAGKGYRWFRNRTGCRREMNWRAGSLRDGAKLDVSSSLAVPITF